MSLKNKFFSALTMAFAVFAFSVFVSAQETTKTDDSNTQKQEKREWRKGNRDGGMGKGFRRGGGGRDGGFMRGFRDLNLTDAQKTQIKTIMDANRPDQATMEEMKTLHQAKRDGTLTADQQERMKTLRQQAREKGAAVHQQILAILTPEQLQQLEAKKAEMKQRREERKQQRLQNQQVPQTEKKDN
jgi:Spy/CpxP family protein refolding chaperone